MTYSVQSQTTNKHPIYSDAKNHERRLDAVENLRKLLGSSIITGRLESVLQHIVMVEMEAVLAILVPLKPKRMKIAA